VLIGGLKRALSQPSAIVFRGVRLESDGETGAYKVTLRRIRGRGGRRPTC
jgi:two-component system CheB/CheR fusion protein